MLDLNDSTCEINKLNMEIKHEYGNRNFDNEDNGNILLYPMQYSQKIDKTLI